MFARTFSTLLAVGALTCAQAEAGVITGIIVDSQGNPVRNALFEIDEQGGDGPTSVLGGMTDAQGAFTTTITPMATTPSGSTRSRRPPRWQS